WPCADTRRVAGSLPDRRRATRKGNWAAIAPAPVAGAGRCPGRRCSEWSRGTGTLGSSPIELGAFRLAVQGEGARLAGGVRADEDPVLPGGQPPEDLGRERFRAGESIARLHPGERVGRERDALFDRDAQLLLEVDLVGEDVEPPQHPSPEEAGLAEDPLGTRHELAGRVRLSAIPLGLQEDHADLLVLEAQAQERIVELAGRANSPGLRAALVRLGGILGDRLRSPDDEVRGAR